MENLIGSSDFDVHDPSSLHDYDFDHSTNLDKSAKKVERNIQEISLKFLNSIVSPMSAGSDVIGSLKKFF